MKSLTIPITRNLWKPEAGADTAIMLLSEDARPDEPLFALWLAQQALQLAEQMGEELRMSVWWVTSDPEELRSKGLHHDCPACRAGVDQALAYLKEFPESQFAIGLLSWC